mmetsp:Transcript_93627/g.238406  ORF Transcript_93627/g.238406 Transcript_93627/m.238406 type:complete len:274 (+) Transcript_93627:126-947(+)
MAEARGYDIARDIGQQVEAMILQAKQANEAKVGKEIGRVKAKMEQVSEKIKLVSERVSRLDGGGGGLSKSDFNDSLGKLESVWESEVGMLKHELWQTIQAHNHNADLLKHHKDEVDKVTTRLAEHATANPDLEQVQQRLKEVDTIVQRERVKDQQMEQLMQRVTLLQQQFTALMASSWGGAGLGAFAGISQAQMLAAAAGSGMAGGGGMGGCGGCGGNRKGQRKDDGAPKRAAKASAKKGPPGAASAQAAAAAASLRAEAPVFVPTAPSRSES